MCKKDDHNNILNNDKDNIRGIWKVLNSVIVKGLSNINYPQFFTLNDETLNNLSDVANGCSKFFVSVRPNLVKKMDIPPS